MGNTLISTISAITIALSTIISPPSALPTPQVHVEAQRPAYTNYVVKKGDSLASIANDYFGNTDYWTTIWNDNPNIDNPSIIEADQELKISSNKPKNVEELLPDLEKRQKSETKIELAQITDSSPVSTDKPIVPVSTPNSLTDTQINFLGNCESGMTANRNSGNGFFGAFQFTIGTWNSMGTGYARADLAPLEVQKDAVQRLVARSSIFGQFPGCSAQMRAQGLL